MKLTQRGNKFYVVKRVPDRLSSIETRKQVWISLQTDSRSEASARAYDAVLDLENQWHAKLAGECNQIHQYDALSKISLSRGCSYLPAEKVAQETLEEILRRVTIAKENETVAASVLGSASKPTYRISQILDLYIDLVAVEVKDKGRDQRRIWENTLKRSLGRLMSVVGDKSVDDLTREDVLAYRNHWVNRIQEEGLTPNTANRELTTIAGVFSKLYKLKGLGDPNLFKNLSFSAKRRHR